MNSGKQILFREMVYDLHYRLRLADDLFCTAAECLISVIALGDRESRIQLIRSISEYSRALRIIDQDLCQIVVGKQAVFPAEFEEWILDLPDGDAKADRQLKRLHVIAKGLELTVNREILRMELKK